MVGYWRVSGDDYWPVRERTHALARALLLLMLRVAALVPSQRALLLMLRIAALLSIVGNIPCAQWRA